MSVADAKAALKACEDGIALIRAQQKANQVLVDDYNKRTQDVQSKRDKYGVEKKAREDVQRDWDKRKTDIFNGNQEEKRWNSCVATWDCDAGKHDDWCRNDFGDGWYHSGKDQNCGACGKHGCTQCHGICKKTDDKRWQEASDQTARERGGRPGDYNEPWPNDAAAIEQNKTPVDIACCANVATIVGSQITDSTLTQQNNCLQSKKDAVTAAEKAAAEKAAAEKAAAEKAAAEKAAAEKAAAEKAAAEKAAAEKAAAEKAAAEKAAAEKAAAEKAAAEKAAAAAGKSVLSVGGGTSFVGDNSRVIIAGIVAALICCCISIILLMLMG